MPNIGEIRRASEVGYKGRALFVWVACFGGCGLERWRPLRQRHILCWPCAAQKRESEIHPITYFGEGQPKIGDTSKPKYLGLGLKGRSVHVYVACPKCGTLRWVRQKVSNELCVSCAVVGVHIGEKSGRWKGGIKKTRGYVYVAMSSDDPLFMMVKRRNQKSGIIAEHRVVMARHLGRPLLDNEIVHHINGIRDDNRIGNLQVLPAHKHHAKLVDQAIQSRLQSLEARMMMVEAENTLLRSVLQEVRDSVPRSHLILQRYNTPGNCHDTAVEGIVRPSSNRGDNNVKSV